jgi:hypothetical protein
VPANAKIDMVDVKRVINEVRKLEPELSKEFRARAQELAQPAIDAARQAYTQVPLSGMARDWKPSAKGRGRGPFVLSKARSGVRLKFDTRRNAVGVLLIEQRDPPTAIFEGAGRKNANRLDTALDNVASARGWGAWTVGQKRTRLIGPAVYRAARRGVTDNLRRLILDVSRELGRRI